MAVTITYKTEKGSIWNTNQEAILADAIEQTCPSIYSYQLQDIVESLTERIEVFSKDSKETEIRNMCHRRRKEDAFPEVLEPVEIPSLLNTEVSVG